MRYFFLIISGVLLVLMLVVFFQNYSAGQPTAVFFLTKHSTISAAKAMFYAFLFGIASAVSFTLFLTGGKLEVNLPHRTEGSSAGEDEWN